MENVMGRGFSARLKCAGIGVRGVVTLSRSNGLTKGGWLLVADGSVPSTPFKFEYQKEADGRFHYSVNSGDVDSGYEGAALGISTNGYLGVYQVASVENLWKLEVIAGQDENRPTRFWLFGAAGEQVKVSSAVRHTGTRYGGVYRTSDRTAYLNTRKGIVAEFELDEVTLLD
ncbi:hypothetical protein [Pseudomonas sp. RIT-To-2]|uniref:hypothetical protein n=1 Tax=Pseudomonas sp. RIT-To-2 TaxID=3462541 RepID=UPI002412F906